MPGQPFTLFDVAQRGMSAQLVRMNAAASNLANAGTVSGSEDAAYKPIRAVFAEDLDQASGLATVQVQGVVREQAAAVREHNPDHPLADENGYVRAPDIDMGSQMSQLIMAQRGFQASVQVTKNAQDTYSSALQIGRG